MEKGIVVAGYAGLDLIKTIRSFPARHGLTEMTGIAQALGGAVCNCSLDMALLEPETTVYPLAVVGEDANGEELLRRLAIPRNIDLSLIRRQGETGFTDVLDEADTRVRTFICFRGSNKLLSEEMIDPAALNCDLFHIGYILLLDALDAPDASSGLAGGADLTNSADGEDEYLARAEELEDAGATYNSAGVCVDFANDGSYATREGIAAEIGASWRALLAAGTARRAARMARRISRLSMRASYERESQ